MFAIIHDCKYGPNLTSHILVAERDNKYIDLMIKYRPWDGKITEDTLLYEDEEMAWQIIEGYMLTSDNKEEEKKDFWLEKIEI